MHNGKLSKPQRDQVRKLKAAGMTLRKIAVMFGVAHPTIHRIVSEKYRRGRIEYSRNRYHTSPEVRARSNAVSKAYRAQVRDKARRLRPEEYMLIS